MNTNPPNQGSIMVNASDIGISPSSPPRTTNLRRFGQGSPSQSPLLAQLHKPSQEVEKRRGEQFLVSSHRASHAPHRVEEHSTPTGSPTQGQRSGREETKGAPPLSSSKRVEHGAQNTISLSSYSEGNVMTKVMGTIQHAYGYGPQGESNSLPTSKEVPSSSGSPMSMRSHQIHTSFSLQRRITHFLQKDHFLKNSSDFGSFPSELLIRCFSFCPLRTLAELSSVNRRFHSLSSTNSLWIPFARSFGLALCSEDDYSHIKQRLREAVLSHRRAKDQEVEKFEKEYASLVRRIKEKSDAIRANPINVEETLQTHNPSSILSEGFSPLSQNGRSKISGSSMEVRVSTDFILHLQNALSEVDGLRKQIVERLDKNSTILARHQKELEAIENHLETYRKSKSYADSTTGTPSTPTVANDGVSGGEGNKRHRNNASLPSPASKATGSYGEPQRNSPLRTFGEAMKEKEEVEPCDMRSLSLEELLAFERRLVKLIINGKNLAPSTANPENAFSAEGVRGGAFYSKEQSPRGGSNEASSSGVLATSSLGPSLSPVFRRGIQDFGTLELLLYATSDSGVNSAVLKPIQGRYDAFKRFFPLNEDYYTLKSIVGTQSHETSEGIRSSLSTSNGSGDSSTIASPLLRSKGTSSIPNKYKMVYKKTGQLIRRIQSMKDSDVLSTVL